MSDRTYTQHDRDRLVAAFLDKTVNDWTDLISDRYDELHGSDFEHPLVGIHEGLSNGPAEYQLYLQALACLSDGSLHDLLSMFGTDPLAEEL